MLASQQGHVLSGMLMLLIYSLGLGLPFLISAVLIDRLKSALTDQSHYAIIQLFSGSFLILVGVHGHRTVGPPAHTFIVNGGSFLETA
ncbi:MAG: cytochrome c biogenesis protein CcdA [Intestinimonas butyriciproducens]|uniref:cytochrome c biogenesis protein CcdA n=1 Tax=Intestinimonas butyriciproducens TaxID=1297617 RepID=UPI0039930CA1